jgi:hypothetical protein
MSKNFVVFDKATGVVKRTGRCRDMDFAGQVMHDGEGIIETERHLHPDKCAVDLVTRQAHSKQ